MRKIVEQLVTYSVLLLTMGAFTNLFLGTDLSRADLDTASQHTPLGLHLLELVIYVGAFSFVLLYYKRTFAALQAAWPLLLVCMTALLSATWSIDSETTLRRSCVLTGTTVFGIYLGGRYSTTGFQHVLRNSLLFLIGASVLLLVFSPTMVLDPLHARAFRGLTEHKNAFGEFMGILLLVSLSYESTMPWPPGRFASMLVAVIFLIWSHSGASMFSVVATGFIVAILLPLRLTLRRAIPLISVGVASIILLSTFVSPTSGLLLTLLGKDETLTGRTEIWDLVEQAIRRRPLLGYGYDAFWHGLSGESQSILSFVGWNVPNSHNGYLEATLGLGILGLCVLGLVVIRTGRDALSYMRREKHLTGLWPAALLTYFLIHAGAEATLLKRDGLSYLVIVVLSTSTSLQRLERRIESPP